MELGEPTIVATVRSLDVAHRVRELADLLEFRMDLAEDDPLSSLHTYDGEVPILVTNRVIGEGGNATAGPERLSMLERAVEMHHVTAVDVELRTIEDGAAEDVTAALGPSTSLIASVHDFNSTPSPEACRDLLTRACDAGDVGKLAVTATDHAEALRLLNVTRWAETHGFTVATMAMGQPGRHTRAVAPIYGSRLAYAPPETDEATAPGQYDLPTLTSILEQL